MKIGIIQRVLAGYRIPFFDLLAQSYDGNLSIYAGEARDEEMIDTSQQLQIANHWQAENRHFLRDKFYLCFQTDILGWLESWDPDVLIIEANIRYPLTLAAIHWMHKRNRPVIGWGLGPGGEINYLKRKFIGQFDALLTYSQTGAQAYQTAGVDPSKIFVARNAAASRPRCEQAIQRNSNFDKNPIILFVGRLQERKRVDLLIQACAALKDDLHPELWIVGDGPARLELNELAAAEYPQTIFWGALYGSNLTEKFNLADLFVLPGTGGLALQEAMACGLPVIAAEADGTQADLIRSENGRIVEPGNLDELITAIRALLSDPAQLRKMGDRSFQIVRQEINLENMVEAFQQAIHYVTIAKKEK